MVQLLVLEKKALKWYGGPAKRYFGDVTRRFLEANSERQRKQQLGPLAGTDEAGATNRGGGGGWEGVAGDHSEPASRSAIEIGSKVELRGLQAKPELNGQRGVVTGFDAASGRCKVLLEDGRGPFRFKPGNIAIMDQ